MYDFLKNLFIMPERHSYYQGFINALQQKIPQNSMLVNTITDILAIDKDAVYRRLRGEVNFSFIEMAAIAMQLGISLDSIVGIVTLEHKPMQTTMSKHVNPSEADYRMFNNYVSVLESIKDEPKTCYMESGNLLSHTLYFDYEQFTRFMIAYWNRCSSMGSVLPYHKITIPKQMQALQKNCCEYTRHIKSVVYVLDHDVFQHLVDNINFFIRVRFINEREASLIKSDLIHILDYIEKLAITGKYEDTENEISFYISDIFIDSNYSILKSKNLNLSQFRTFLLNSNYSSHEEVCAEVNSWINALQSASTLISVSGEKVRTTYFNAQRKILATLL